MGLELQVGKRSAKVKFKESLQKQKGLRREKILKLVALVSTRINLITKHMHVRATLILQSQANRISLPQIGNP